MTTEQWVQRTAAEYAQAWNNLLPTGPAWPRQPGTVQEEVITGLAGIWGVPVESLAALLLTTESDPRATTVLLPDWERAWGLPDLCLAEPLTIGARQTALVQRITLLGAASRAFIESLALTIGYTIKITEYRPFMVGIDRVGDNRIIGGTSTTATVTGAISGTGGVIWLKLGAGDSGSVAEFGGGDSVTVASVGGTTEANGTWTVDVVNTGGTTYYLALRGSTFVHAWTSGGTLLANLPMYWQNGDLILDPTGAPVGNGVTSEYPYMLGPDTNAFYWTVHVTLASLTWFRCSDGQCGVDPHLRIGLATDLECLLNRYKPAHTSIVWDYTNLGTAGAMTGTP